MLCALDTSELWDTVRRSSSLDEKGAATKKTSEFVDVVETAHTVKLLREERFSDVAGAVERGESVLSPMSPRNSENVGTVQDGVPNGHANLFPGKGDLHKRVRVHGHGEGYLRYVGDVHFGKR